jgi:hypothetical protein
MMAGTHSRWSASASGRNMACPGSLILSELGDPGGSSIYAAWGTLMHHINERSVRDGTYPNAYLGTVHEIDGFTITVDEEMAAACEVCVGYVRDLVEAGAELWLEEKFDLAPLGFPMEAGGTGDVIAWTPSTGTIEVVDYKGGRGKVVEIFDNTQLPHYGLGALVKHPELPVKRVKMTIVQPRIPHDDGVIRSVEWHPSDLVDFANDIDAAMRRSIRALESFHAGEIEAWGEEWLHPGDHCTFCPAAGSCPALRKQSQELVNLHWDAAGVPATVSVSSPDAVERDLDVFDLIEHWIAERRAYAHQLAEGGHQFDNWVLVERNGHRKWRIPTEPSAAQAIGIATGLPDSVIYDRKLKSPAGIEKLLGKDKGKIAGLFYTPVTGKDLVRRSKAASRRPAQSLVDAFFETEQTEGTEK